MIRFSDFKAKVKKLEKSAISNNEYFGRLLQLIPEIENFKAAVIEMPAGESIYRARPCKEKNYTNQSQLSYNPNTTRYDRASGPDHPMFYGSIRSSKVSYPMITNLFEVVQILRQPKLDFEGTFEFTVGQWIVTNPIKIYFTIPRVYAEKNEEANNLRSQFEKNLKSQGIEKSIEIVDYFGEWFAKYPISSSRDYIKTAAYTAYITSLHSGILGGVFYPSVRTEGDGFNVALTPKAVKKCLRLNHVVQIRLYAKNKHVVVDNMQGSEVDKNGNFELTAIRTSEHMGNRRSEMLLGHLIMNDINDFQYSYKHHIWGIES